jgi:hypothetical protein
MKRPIVIAGLAAGLMLLAACSSGTEETASTQSSSAAPSSSSAAPSSAKPSESSPSPESTEILAVLCDEATAETIAVLEAQMDPDFTLSQLIDVRTSDDGPHAVMGFVEGPGLAVLAQWTGTGLSLEGLAAANEFAAQVTDVPLAKPDEATQALLDETVNCYTAVNIPEDGDDKKKDDNSAE